MPRTTTLSEQARDVLARAHIEGSQVHLTAGQLDRQLYQEVNKALVAIGGKWDRAAQAHLFTTDPSDGLAHAVATGVVAPPEHKLSSFWVTPDELADRLAAPFANRFPGGRVLEPSAGDGAIVRALRRANEHLHITALEPHIGRAQAIQGADEVRIEKFEDWASDGHDDTLEGIVMNPPFTLPGEPLAYIDHLDIALDHLAETGGGDLIAIVPAGFEFRDDARVRAMRHRVEDMGGGVTALPPQVFATSGTGVSTLLVEVEVP